MRLAKYFQNIFILSYFLISITTKAQQPITEVLQQNDSLPFTTLATIEIIPLPYDTIYHPYLSFNKEDIDELKIRVNHPELFNRWKALKEDALNPSNHLWFFSNGVLSGGIAYQLTGERKYADSAMVLIKRMLSQDYNWTAPDKLADDIKYMNIGIGDKALSLAYAFDYLQDVMTHEDLEACKNALQNRIYPAYIDAHSYHDKEKGIFHDRAGNSDWWTYCYFNWNSTINGCIGLAALASLWEVPESRMVIQMARASLRYTHPEFNQPIESGGYDEGVHSYYRHIAELTRFYTALDNVLGKTDGFFELPGVEKSLQFAIDFTSPDGRYVPFGTSALAKAYFPPSELHYLGNYYNRRDFTNHLDNITMGDKLSHYTLFWRPILNDTIKIPNYPNLSFYKDIHWGVFYDDNIYVPFKAGDNAANGTPLSAGEIMLWYKDNLVLTSHPQKTETEFHNCLMINGENQLKGNPRLRDKGGYSETLGIISVCEEKDGIYQATMNLKSCYNSVTDYNRYVLLDQNGYLFVLDEVIAPMPVSIDINWHYKGNTTQTTDSTFIIETANKETSVYCLSNVSIKCVNENENKKHRIHISSNENVEKAYILSCFSSCKCGIPNLSLENNEQNLTIKYTKRGKQIEHLFIKQNESFIYQSRKGE